ncbi:ComEA family DNA-binding protein [Paenibacillus aurantiacus]|uniref:ComEA family DNA-binding protein n=1 Tax=Paenibacillus aurantiacus TaxID=1936118 RepID=A0ABV5KJY1_9BACL
MKALRSTKGSSLLIIVLLLIGASLMIGAWSETKASPPTGWTDVSQEVEAALESPADGSGTAAVGKDNGNNTVHNADKTKGSGQPVEAGAVGSNQATTGGGSQEAGEVTAGGANPESAGAESKASTVPAEITPAYDSSDAKTAAAEGKLDINRASAEELDALPGIGAAKAKAIVVEREAGGAFGSADDLLRVKGIGPKLLAKLKPHVVALP